MDDDFIVTVRAVTGETAAALGKWPVPMLSGPENGDGVSPAHTFHDSGRLG